MMTEQEKNARILHLIRTYGADPERWPATESVGQPVLSGHLQTAAAEEDALDTLIAAAHAPEPSAALQGRILDIPRRMGAASGATSTGGWWILSGFWRPAGAAVFVLAMGILVGQINVPVAQTAADPEAELLFSELVMGPADIALELPQ